MHNKSNQLEFNSPTALYIYTCIFPILSNATLNCKVHRKTLMTRLLVCQVFMRYLQ